jgi:hypothetical protein
MILFVNIFDNADLWPHFVRHYRALGVTHFCVGIYRMAENPVTEKITPIDDCSVERFSFLDGWTYNGPEDSEAQDRMRQKLVNASDWYAVADLDEFAVCPMNITGKFKEEIAISDSRGEQVICGGVFDRTTADGSLPAHLEDNIWRQFPMTLELTKRFVRGNASKVVLARGDVPISSGHHVVGQIGRWGCIVYHFKWRANMVETQRKRLVEYRRIGIPWVDEQERLLRHIDANGGKLNIEELSRLDVEGRFVLSRELVALRAIVKP